jgi:hypothetical protein
MIPYQNVQASGFTPAKELYIQAAAAAGALTSTQTHNSTASTQNGVSRHSNQSTHSRHSYNSNIARFPTKCDIEVGSSAQQMGHTNASQLRKCNSAGVERQEVRQLMPSQHSNRSNLAQQREQHQHLQCREEEVSVNYDQSNAMALRTNRHLQTHKGSVHSSEARRAMNPPLNNSPRQTTHWTNSPNPHNNKSCAVHATKVQTSSAETSSVLVHCNQKTGAKSSTHSVPVFSTQRGSGATQLPQQLSQGQSSQGYVSQGQFSSQGQCSQGDGDYDQLMMQVDEFPVDEFSLMGKQLMHVAFFFANI